MADKSSEFIRNLIKLSTDSLDNLYASDISNNYTRGEKIAFVEILEIIQRNDKDNLYNLNYKIEEKYPI